MATGLAYDEWEDTGLSFTEEQIASYDPRVLAAARVNQLTEWASLCEARSWMGEAVKWWETTARALVSIASWYCVTAVIPRFDDDDVLKPEATAKLNSAALKLGEPSEFLDAWEAQARTEMVQHVTLGRRCSEAKGVWGKKEKSMSNKLANAIYKEIHSCSTGRERLVSRKAKKLSAVQGGKGRVTLPDEELVTDVEMPDHGEFDGG